MSWPCTERGAATASARSPLLTRRDCLLTALALAASAATRVAFAAAPADAELRAALDALLPRKGSSQPSASARLATLAHFRAEALSASAAIDLQTVRAGLAVDQRIEALGGTHGGNAHFALLLDRALGEAITPAAAHRVLGDEVRRLSHRAETLLRDLGYRHGTLGARFNAAASDPRFLYSDDAAGRDRAVADMNWRLHTAKARLAQGDLMLVGAVYELTTGRVRFL